jgi:hypothetical protein
MVTRSLAAVGLGLGVLCMAMGAIGGPLGPASGSFAIAGAILIGASLITWTLDERK